MNTLKRNTRIAATGIAGITLALTASMAMAFKEPGKIIAGSDMTYPPFEFIENNKPAGFDIEFLAGVAKVMGMKAENIDTRWANLIPGLRGGRFDILNSSMYITEERVKVIDMIPYLKSGQSIVALSGSKFKPKTFEDLCGHKVGSMAGTVFLSKVQQISAEHCEAKGLDPIAISEYPTDPETTQAVLSRAVEVQVTDGSVAAGIVEKLGGRIEITSEELLFPVLNGMAVRKGNDEVKDALIEGIEKFSKTAEYQALLKKYNFQAPTPEDIEKLMPKP